MSHPLNSEDLLKTLRFIHRIQQEYGVSPPWRDIGAEVRGAPTTGLYLVRHCEAAGWLTVRRQDRRDQEVEITEDGLAALKEYALH